MSWSVMAIFYLPHFLQIIGGVPVVGSLFTAVLSVVIDIIRAVWERTFGRPVIRMNDRVLLAPFFILVRSDTVEFLYKDRTQYSNTRRF